MNIIPFFITHSQSSLIEQPVECRFDDIAELAKAAAVFGVAFRDERFRSDLTQGFTVCFRVVSSVSVQLIKTIARCAALARNRRYVVDQWKQLRNVVAIGASETRSDRQSSSIGQQVMLRAWFSAVYRARTGFSPPRPPEW